MKLIECVPNFSEGRDLSKIKAITNSIESIDEITLLDVDPGPDTNRTVVTFIGPPEAVELAIFLGIKTASEVIDMSKHKGTHPRIGATDVCPLIPINNVSDKESIDLSKKIAKSIIEKADEINADVIISNGSHAIDNGSDIAKSHIPVMSIVHDLPMFPSIISRLN